MLTARFVPWALPAASLLIGCNAIFGVERSQPLADVGAAGGGGTNGSVSSSASGAGGATSGTAGSAGSGGGGGAGGQTPSCNPGNIHTLVDDFEDSTFDPHWFPWGNDVSEMAGGLQFQVPPTSTEYSGVTSQQSYDLRGCAIAIEVLTVPTSTPSAEAYLAVSDNVANSSLAMGAHDGELFMRHFEDSGLVSEDTLPFDPTNHRWWRMSEDGGQIVFATSADGVSWTNRWQIGTPAFVSTVMVDIIAGAYASNDSSATATFDNLNILPRP